MKPLGRPPIDNPKDKRLQVRVDGKAIVLLDKCAKAKGTNRSEIVREGIKLVSAIMGEKEE